MTLDPVCGMTVEPLKARGSFTHRDIEYFFCSTGCKEKFSCDPDKYLNKPQKMFETSRTTNPSSDVVYTCPMHPEIEQIGPGACPKCGMDLEPREVSYEPEDVSDDPMLRRFWISLVPTILVFAIAMSDMIPGLNAGKYFSHEFLAWAQFVLATPVVLYGGSLFFSRGWSLFVVLILICLV